MQKNRLLVLSGLGFIASKQTKGEERALVPIKSKLVVAVVLEADFAEIILMRNVNERRVEVFHPLIYGVGGVQKPVK